MFNPDLYLESYHQVDLSKYRILVTGGAGFIGSNLVEYLLKYGVGKVRVLDNLSNGYWENIQEFITLPNFEFVDGDIRNLETCKEAVSGMDLVAHLAALGSVPRSVADPITSNEVNISGFLNMLVACRDEAGCQRMVYAASSSTYGDSTELPKVEGREGKPLSPYAVTKAVNEMYADVFSRVYGMHTIGLRYFNVFGPKQNPNNPYAAVIPLFCKHFLEGTRPTIYGDGETSRDFTFVENAVQANVLALLYGLDKKDAIQLKSHEVYNVACGDQTTLNQMVQILQKITRKSLEPFYGPERAGDVRQSKASISKIAEQLKYQPRQRFEEGLGLVMGWYKTQLML
ncbi:MAG: SDR family oxidoreductase [Bacteroidetes bacterium]|nr:SDR family oxidoreductase [Bacteroidota bacterium]